MAKCVIVLPWANGSAQLPGLTDEQRAQCSWSVASYAPPPAGTAPYVLVKLNATDAAIATLTARADCLFCCTITEEGYSTTPLTPTERNAVRAKVAAMGFTGAQYGLLNAAIQSSQNRAELAYAMATKAFFQHVNKAAMTNADLDGCQVGG